MEDANRNKMTSSTSIAALPTDLLEEIFLGLPSLASLIRASCACQHWRSVASTPDFLGRFRDAHLPFTCFVAGDFSFYPVAGASDADGRDFVAALRRSYISYWRVWDCRRGLLLTFQTGRRRPERMMMVYDPIAARCFTVNRPPVAQPGRYFTDCLLPPAAAGGEGSGNRASFRIVSLRYHGQQIRATVYNSDTKQWTPHPSDIGLLAGPRPWPAGITYYDSPMHAAGCVYWKYPCKDDTLLSLDTLTTEFSVVPLPPGVTDMTPYAVGETRDAKCCLVSFVDGPSYWQMMQVWLRREGNAETQFWEKKCQSQFPATASDLQVLHVHAVAAGIVLVCVTKDIAGTIPLERVAICVESFEVKARFKSTESIIVPYQMAWPPL